MTTRLTYAIKFVADMDQAIAFHRDVLGLPVRFTSPEWSEFETGATTLALHAASDRNPAGRVELGFAVGDVDAFHRDHAKAGIVFTEPPRDLHGTRVATFLDPDNAKTSVSGG
jgi:lactoylglutathione lyase